MKQVLDYISGDSAKNARKVVEEIIIAATKAIADPGISPPDKYRINNNWTYRAFEKHQFRVSYRVEKSFIRILSVRHTSRKPKQY